MKRLKEGAAIINTTSVTAYEGSAQLLDYSSTKGAITSFTRSLSLALAEKTAFDAVLVVIIGSMLARAINGSGPFFATLGGGFILVLLHRFFGLAAYYSHGFRILIKGKTAVLVQNGRLQRKN